MNCSAGTIAIATTGTDNASETSSRVRGDVLDEDDGGARSQAAGEEPRVGLGEFAPLRPEVGHPGDHQLILDLVVHVMQDHIGVGVEQAWGVDVGEPARVDSLSRPDPGVKPPQHRPRQPPADPDRGRSDRALLQMGKRLTAQCGGQAGLQHRC
ncbi:MAG: hypothetical protein ACRDST_08960 [Pseudonocardiaceae bacterium]